MTIHRLIQAAGFPFRGAAAILVLLPFAVSPALADQRHAPRATGVPTTYDTLGSVDAERTGALVSIPSFGVPARSMRSSTLGNAEFPERDPSAQNLGMTSGGGLH